MGSLGRSRRALTFGEAEDWYNPAFKRLCSTLLSWTWFCPRASAVHEPPRRSDGSDGGDGTRLDRRIVRFCPAVARAGGAGGRVTRAGQAATDQCLRLLPIRQQAVDRASLRGVRGR